MSRALAAAYAGYLLWQLAGTADFACHRRTGLPQTSGVAESAMHVVQLSIVGLGVGIVLTSEVTATVLVLLALLAALHSAAAYVDTRVAYPHREIGPFEQHVHSVLDMAPWIALGIVAAMSGALAAPDWQLRLREPPLDLMVWAVFLVPPAVLCWLPALLELRSAWMANGHPASRTRAAAAPGAAPPSGAARAHPTGRH